MNTSEIQWHFCRNNRKPTMILETKDETLAFLSAPELPYPTKYEVCSIYLCDFLDELEKDGYVYNDPAQRAFEAAHGLPESPTSGSQISILIYNCQGYRRARQLEAAGWKPISPELLSFAHTMKLKLEITGDSMLCSGVVERFVVRDTPGGFQVFRPRTRKPLSVAGMPARLVA